MYEDQEDLVDEEHEEGSEDEIYEDFDEDAADEYLDEEIEEVVVEYVEEEDPEEELNEEQPVENSYPSSSVTGGKDHNRIFGNKLNEDSGGGMKVVECCGGSGKRRKSRWDLDKGGETPQTDGTNKRRKTRWDNSGSQNDLVELSGFSSPMALALDPKIMSLKMQLFEINKKLLSSEILDEKPAEERSPSPEPEYNNLGIRTNTRDARLRKKLINEQKRIISKLAKTNLIFKTPKRKPTQAVDKPVEYVKKIFIPVTEYPEYNFIGLILGPKGNTQKKMEKETGANIRLRGKGSGNPESDDEELHVRVEANNQQALNAAVGMIEKLLIPVADQRNDHKRAQLAELAKLRGNYNDDNICNLCKEPGHKQYACPLQDSTFKAVCDICGSFSHLTSNCRASGSALHSTDRASKEVDFCNVYVGYLPNVVDEKWLKELFSPFGKIIQTTIIKDKITGLSKGYGFVKFESPTDASEAVTYMNGYRMDGKMLAVRVAGQKPGPISLNSGQVPIHSPSIGLLTNIPRTNGPLLPEAHGTTSNNETFGFPSSSGYSRCDVDIGQSKSQNNPSYVTSSSCEPTMMNGYSPGYGFHSQIPSGPISQFPGEPEHQGSQFKSYFAIPTVQGTDTEHVSQMPVTEQKSNLWSASLPLARQVHKQAGRFGSGAPYP